jgi:hypothetical protein
MTAGTRVTPEQLDSLGARVMSGSGQVESELRAPAGVVAPCRVGLGRRRTGALPDPLAGVADRRRAAAHGTVRHQPAFAGRFGVRPRERDRAELRTPLT